MFDVRNEILKKIEEHNDTVYLTIGYRWKNPTKRISSTIFSTAAMAMNTNGLRESPMPRRMAETIL